MIDFSEFQKKFCSGEHCARRIINEVRIALRSWALFNAINGNNLNTRDKLRAVLKHHQLGGYMHYMRLVLAQDCLMAIFRATDQKQDDRLTFPRIAEKLSDGNHLREIISHNQSQNTYCGKMNDHYEKQCIIFAREFLATIPMDWKNSKLSNDLIKKFRTKYRKLRDSTLAHSLNNYDVQNPIIDEISEVLTELAKQADNIAYIYFGYPENLEEYSNIKTNESFELWDLLEASVYDRELRENPGFASDKDQIR